MLNTIRPSKESLLAALVLSATLLLAGALSATPLTGSGDHLPIPAPNPAWPPGIAPDQVAGGGGFTGTWTGAHPDWNGSFSADGPIPSAFATGVTSYDFSTLPLGYLPAGTFFIFSDVDDGSNNQEEFHLQAFDALDAVIAVTWLDETFAVTGAGTGAGGTVLSTDMPGWDWNLTGPNEYLITGTTVTDGNPNLAVALVTNQPIYGLTLRKPTTHYSFSLQAPVPEPGTGALLVWGVLGMGCSRRQANRRRYHPGTSP